jgi:hypothetical protein
LLHRDPLILAIETPHYDVFFKKAAPIFIITVV